MGLPTFTTRTLSINDLVFNGGLNSTGGPFSLQNNESSDLQNIDFSRFGSILKRNGYLNLNSSSLSAQSDGLHWYEYNNSGTNVRKLMQVAGGALYKMDDLDGTWDDITGTLTITADNHCDFENFLNEVYITNGEDLPFKWDGSASAAMSVPSGLTKAKYVRQFNNYLFLANVLVSATYHPNRIYWSDFKDTSTWSATSFLDIAKNDGQEITGLRVLGDRLVVFKSRSIYNAFFTGNRATPFVLPGGGKSNSPVGCVAPWSIQEVENGLIFLSYDGFYFYDGMNAFKISDKITNNIISYNRSYFQNCVSLNQKNKNRYWCAFPVSGQTQNSVVLVLDYFNNAWSLYDGMNPAAMCTVYVDGIEERPYFADYSGYTYRADYGEDDYPLGVQTAIDAYYYTNWRAFDDLSNQKGIPNIYIYYQNSNTLLDFAYSYDFEDGDTYSSQISLATSSDVYGVALYDVAKYAGAGGSYMRRDLTGRGRVIRFKFANNSAGETFQIDGLGTLAYLETRV